MGKYMRKARVAGEIAVMEVSHQSYLGVRTRARTLALQRLHKPPSPARAPPPTAEPDASSYLQLRNRRLEKSLAVASRPKDGPRSGVGATPEAKNPKPNLASCSAKSGSAGSASAAKSSSKEGGREEQEASPDSDGVEASFGENVLEFEARDGNVRETTPCSLIRNSEITGTPGSTTRPRTTPKRAHNTRRSDIPTSEELEEFFAGAERQQQKIFTEKYNFDPANDCPLPGRYEWVRLDF